MVRGQVTYNVTGRWGTSSNSADPKQTTIISWGLLSCHQQALAMAATFFSPCWWSVHTSKFVWKATAFMK